MPKHSLSTKEILGLASQLSLTFVGFPVFEGLRLTEQLASVFKVILLGVVNVGGVLSIIVIVAVAVSQLSGFNFSHIW